MRGLPFAQWNALIGDVFSKLAALVANVQRTRDKIVELILPRFPDDILKLRCAASY